MGYVIWIVICFFVAILAFLTIALSPVVAIGAVIFGLLIAFIVIMFQANRRSLELGSEHEAVAKDRGAPVSGEGNGRRP